VRGSRFGQKIKIPSTFSLKFQMLMMSLEEEIWLLPHNETFDGAKSPALARLRHLMTTKPVQTETLSRRGL
jgi:hypothetical protein